MTDDALMEMLGRAHSEFGRRVALIGLQDYGAPTPCHGWSVRALLDHVLGGSVRYAMLLDGAEQADLAPTRALDFVADGAVDSFETGADALAAAFAEPGALERIVHHRAGDCPGRELLGLRILECTLHAWDLARAIGVDDRLDPGLLRCIQELGPLVDRLRAHGFYGDALPAPADASMQQRVLLASGRQP